MNDEEKKTPETGTGTSVVLRVTLPPRPKRDTPQPQG
jgi:hypothetical protein